MSFYKMMGFCITVLLSIIFFNCVSTQDNLSQDTVSTDENWVAPPRMNPPPSPGTVKAVAQIMEITEENGQPMAMVRIQKVIQYGPATPLLPAGSEIVLDIPQPLFEKATGQDKQTVSRGNTITVTLKRSQRLISEEAKSRWKMIEIHE
jgi:hypothetical protein